MQAAWRKEEILPEQLIQERPSILFSAGDILLQLHHRRRKNHWLPPAAAFSSSVKVLLLERGRLPYDNPNVTHVTGFPASLANTSSGSASQLFVSLLMDGVFNLQSRVLRGISALNAGFYTRASGEYVGQAGWDTLLLNASYEWVGRARQSRLCEVLFTADWRSQPLL